MGYPVWFGGSALAATIHNEVTVGTARRGADCHRHPAHRRRRLGHQAVHLGHRAEDGGRARHARVRHLLHGDQHRLAVRPRHGVRRAERVGRRDHRRHGRRAVAGRLRHRACWSAARRRRSAPGRTSGSPPPASRVDRRPGGAGRRLDLRRAQRRSAPAWARPASPTSSPCRPSPRSWRSSSCCSSTASRPPRRARPSRSDRSAASCSTWCWCFGAGGSRCTWS